MDNKVRLAIFVYIVGILAIALLFPSWIFNANGELKPFGLEPGQSILAAPVLVFALPILIYLVLQRGWALGGLGPIAV